MIKIPTIEEIAFKKWRTKLIFKWLGSLVVAGAIIPLAVFVGGFWVNLAQIMLPFAFGIMIGTDVKNGNAVIQKLNASKRGE